MFSVYISNKKKSLQILEKVLLEKSIFDNLLNYKSSCAHWKTLENGNTAIHYIEIYAGLSIDIIKYFN